MLRKDTETIEQSIIELVYHMKGGITLFEAYVMSPEDRNKAIKYINKVYEIQEAALSGKQKL